MKLYNLFSKTGWQWEFDDSYFDVKEQGNNVKVQL